MLLILRAKLQAVYLVDDVSKVVATCHLVVYFVEDLADFVFNGVSARGTLFETFEIREEFGFNELDEVFTGKRRVVVNCILGVTRGCPDAPSVLFVKDVLVLLFREFGFLLSILLKCVEVLQE